MKPVRQSYTSFLATTLEYQQSQQINPEHLGKLVARLRSGDWTVKDEIITGHLRLVMSIVGGALRNRFVIDDIIGAALLSLTEAVNRASTNLYDNNITAYITECVKYDIKEAYSRYNHMIRKPARTIRHKISTGEKTYADFAIGSGLGGQIVEDVERSTYADTDNLKDYYSLHAGGFSVPIAPVTEPSAEITEALTKIIENETERAIIKLRSEGYTYEEVGKRVGYGRQSICKMIAILEERFDKIYKP